MCAVRVLHEKLCVLRAARPPAAGARKLRSRGSS
jgi:hypothetical protein